MSVFLEIAFDQEVNIAPKYYNMNLHENHKELICSLRFFGRVDCWLTQILRLRRVKI